MKSQMRLRWLAGFTLITFAAGQVYSSPVYAAPSAKLNTSEISFPAEITQVELPKELGRIENVFNGTSSQKVIVVQDAHAIPQAQQSIEKIIEYFQDRYGLEWIGLEGASSQLDPLMFQSFPDKEKMKKVFREYYERGELTGSVAAAIFSQKPASFHGIENWDLYEKGLELYLEAVRKQPQLLNLLEAREEELRIKKQKVYSPELLEVDKALRGFLTNSTNLTGVLRLLSKYQKPREGTEVALMLNEVLKAGSDVSSLESEVKLLLQEFEKQIRFGAPTDKRKEVEREFQSKRQEFQTSRISAQQLALWLKEEAEKEGFMLKISGSLMARLKEHKKLRDIEGTSFYREFSLYAENVKKQLSKSSEDRVLNRESKRQEVLRKLIQLQLTRDEWEKLQSGIANPKVGIEKLLGVSREEVKAQLEFYENAGARDHAFFENLLKLSSKHPHRSVRLIVAGGFHAYGLTEQLKAEGISYALILPEMGAVPEKTNYQDQMQGNVSWKNYFQVENGRVNLYKAFVRGTRDRLLDTVGSQPGIVNSENPSYSALHSSRMLKYWRDQIIRNLADQKQIEKAGDYTRFLDELTSGRDAFSENFDPVAKIDRFVDGLKNLKLTSRVTEQNIMNLAKTITHPGAVAATVVAQPDGTVRIGNIPVVSNIKPGESGEKGVVTSLRSESREEAARKIERLRAMAAMHSSGRSELMSGGNSDEIIKDEGKNAFEIGEFARAAVEEGQARVLTETDSVQVGDVWLLGSGAFTKVLVIDEIDLRYGVRLAFSPYNFSGKNALPTYTPADNHAKKAGLQRIRFEAARTSQSSSATISSEVLPSVEEDLSKNLFHKDSRISQDAFDRLMKKGREIISFLGSESGKAALEKAIRDQNYEAQNIVLLRNLLVAIVSSFESLGEKKRVFKDAVKAIEVVLSLEFRNDEETYFNTMSPLQLKEKLTAYYALAVAAKERPYAEAFILQQNTDESNRLFREFVGQFSTRADWLALVLNYLFGGEALETIFPQSLLDFVEEDESLRANLFSLNGVGSITRLIMSAANKVDAASKSHVLYSATLKSFADFMDEQGALNTAVIIRQGIDVLESARSESRNSREGDVPQGEKETITYEGIITLNLGGKKTLVIGSVDDLKTQYGSRLIGNLDSRVQFLMVNPDKPKEANALWLNKPLLEPSRIPLPSGVLREFQITLGPKNTITIENLGISSGIEYHFFLDPRVNEVMESFQKLTMHGRELMARELRQALPVREGEEPLQFVYGITRDVVAQVSKILEDARRNYGFNTLNADLYDRFLDAVRARVDARAKREDMSEGELLKSKGGSGVLANLFAELESDANIIALRRAIQSDQIKTIDSEVLAAAKEKALAIGQRIPAEVRAVRSQEYRQMIQSIEAITRAVEDELLRRDLEDTSVSLRPIENYPTEAVDARKLVNDILLNARAVGASAKDIDLELAFGLKTVSSEPVWLPSIKSVIQIHFKNLPPKGQAAQTYINQTLKPVINTAISRAEMREEDATSRTEAREGDTRRGFLESLGGMGAALVLGWTLGVPVEVMGQVKPKASAADFRYEKVIMSVYAQMQAEGILPKDAEAEKRYLSEEQLKEIAAFLAEMTARDFKRQGAGAGLREKGVNLKDVERYGVSGTFQNAYARALIKIWGGPKELKDLIQKIKNPDEYYKTNLFGDEEAFLKGYREVVERAKANNLSEEAEINAFLDQSAETVYTMAVGMQGLNEDKLSAPFQRGDATYFVREWARKLNEYAQAQSALKRVDLLQTQQGIAPGSLTLGAILDFLSLYKEFNRMVDGQARGAFEKSIEEVMRRPASDPQRKKFLSLPFISAKNRVFEIANGILRSSAVNDILGDPELIQTVIESFEENPLADAAEFEATLKKNLDAVAKTRKEGKVAAPIIPFDLLAFQLEIPRGREGVEKLLKSLRESNGEKEKIIKAFEEARLAPLDKGDLSYERDRIQNILFQMRTAPAVASNPAERSYLQLRQDLDHMLLTTRSGIVLALLNKYPQLIQNLERFNSIAAAEFEAGQFAKEYIRLFGYVQVNGYDPGPRHMVDFLLKNPKILEVENVFPRVLQMTDLRTAAVADLELRLSREENSFSPKTRAYLPFPAGGDAVEKRARIEDFVRTLKAADEAVRKAAADAEAAEEEKKRQKSKPKAAVPPAMKPEAEGAKTRSESREIIPTVQEFAAQVMAFETAYAEAKKQYRDAQANDNEAGMEVPEWKIWSQKELFQPVLKSAEALGLDTRPIRAGILGPLFVGHAMEIRRAINPEPKPGQIAIYGAAGTDISKYLLTVGAPEAYFLEPVPVWTSKLQDALRSWTEDGSYDLNENYRMVYGAIGSGFDMRDANDFKRTNGFSSSGEYDFGEKEARIMVELKAMGVRKSSVRIGEDEREITPYGKPYKVPYVEFLRAEKEGEPEKTYRIYFVPANLTAPGQYPEMIRSLEGKADYYFQEAAWDTAHDSDFYLPALSGLLRPGGMLITDDRDVISRFGSINILEHNPEIALRKFGIQYENVQKPQGTEVWSAALLNHQREMARTPDIALNENYIRYGWDVALRRVLKPGDFAAQIPARTAWDAAEAMHKVFYDKKNRDLQPRDIYHIFYEEWAKLFDRIGVNAESKVFIHEATEAAITASAVHPKKIVLSTQDPPTADALITKKETFPPFKDAYGGQVEVILSRGRKGFIQNTYSHAVVQSEDPKVLEKVLPTLKRKAVLLIPSTASDLLTEIAKTHQVETGRILTVDHGKTFFQELILTRNESRWAEVRDQSLFAGNRSSMVPDPSESYFIERDKLARWQAAHRTWEEIRQTKISAKDPNRVNLVETVAGLIAQNLNVISPENFLSGVEDVTKKLSESLGGSDYVLLVNKIPGKVEDIKSDLWVYGLAKTRFGLKPPAAVVDGENIEKYLAEHPQIKDVVVMDDGAYSGRQIRLLVRNLPAGINARVAVPFATSNAVTNIKEGAVADVEVISYAGIPTFLQILTEAGADEELIRVARDMYMNVDTATLTMLSYKIPDDWSVLSSHKKALVLNGGVVLDRAAYVAETVPFVDRNFYSENPYRNDDFWQWLESEGLTARAEKREIVATDQVQVEAIAESVIAGNPLTFEQAGFTKNQVLSVNADEFFDALGAAAQTYSREKGAAGLGVTQSEIDAAIGEIINILKTKFSGTNKKSLAIVLDLADEKVNLERVLSNPELQGLLSLVLMTKQTGDLRVSGINLQSVKGLPQKALLSADNGDALPALTKNTVNSSVAFGVGAVRKGMGQEALNVVGLLLEMAAGLLVSDMSEVETAGDVKDAQKHDLLKAELIKQLFGSEFLKDTNLNGAIQFTTEGFTLDYTQLKLMVQYLARRAVAKAA